MLQDVSVLTLAYTHMCTNHLLCHDQYLQLTVSNRILICDPMYFLICLFSLLKLVVRVLVAQWCLTLCDPVDCAHQAPLSMGFCRQEDWGGLPCPPPGDLPNPGMEPGSPVSQADSSPYELPGLH